MPSPPPHSPTPQPSFFTSASADVRLHPLPPLPVSDSPHRFLGLGLRRSSRSSRSSRSCAFSHRASHVFAPALSLHKRQSFLFLKKKSSTVPIIFHRHGNRLRTSLHRVWDLFTISLISAVDPTLQKSDVISTDCRHVGGGEFIPARRLPQHFSRFILGKAPRC